MSPKECFQGCNKILSGLKQIFVRIWPKKCLPLQQEFSFLQFLVQSDIFWRPIFPKIFRGICPLAPVRSAAQRRIYWGVSPPKQQLQPLPEEPPTPSRGTSNPHKKSNPPEMFRSANRRNYFSKFFACGKLLFYPYYENVFFNFIKWIFFQNFSPAACYACKLH